MDERLPQNPDWKSHGIGSAFGRERRRRCIEAGQKRDGDLQAAWWRQLDSQSICTALLSHEHSTGTLSRVIDAHKHSAMSLRQSQRQQQYCLRLQVHPGICRESDSLTAALTSRICMIETCNQARRLGVIGPCHQHRPSHNLHAQVGFEINTDLFSQLAVCSSNLSSL